MPFSLDSLFTIYYSKNTAKTVVKYSKYVLRSKPTYAYLQAWIGSRLSNGMASYMHPIWANFLVDYLQTKRELSPKSSFTEYQLKDLEQPKIIKSSDFLQVDKKKAEGKPEEEVTKPAIQQKDHQMTFNAPIERQGIPLNEYIKIACKSGNEIFQPTI